MTDDFSSVFVADEDFLPGDLLRPVVDVTSLQYINLFAYAYRISTKFYIDIFFGRTV